MAAVRNGAKHKMGVLKGDFQREIAAESEGKGNSHI